MGFLRNKARGSDKRSSGTSFVVFGVGLCIISLIVTMIIESTGVAPQSGRGQFLAAFGLPAGIIVAIAGFIMIARGRNR